MNKKCCRLFVTRSRRSFFLFNKETCIFLLIETKKRKKNFDLSIDTFSLLFFSRFFFFFHSSFSFNSLCSRLFSCLFISYIFFFVKNKLILIEMTVSRTTPFFLSLSLPKTSLLHIAIKFNTLLTTSNR